jgi:hypothetical protein
MTEKARSTQAKGAKASGEATRAKKKPVRPGPIGRESAATEPIFPESATPESVIPELVIRDGIDLTALAEIAALYVPVDDAAELLEVDAAVLQAMLDDPASPHACTWRKGRAGARRAVRKAQFDLMGKNASLAIHMGRELLGQDGGGPVGPTTFLVDPGVRGAD